MKDSNMKTPIVFYAGLILLFFVMLSLNMTGGLYARYATDDEDGDTARTASFEIITTELDALDQNPEHIIARVKGLEPGLKTALPITVSNKSEVAVKYSVRAENVTKNIPLVISATDADIAPNSSGTVTVTVEWPNNNDMNQSPDLAGKTDIIRITFTAEQID